MRTWTTPAERAADTFREKIRQELGDDVYSGEVLDLEVTAAAVCQLTISERNLALGGKLYAGFLDVGNGEIWVEASDTAPRKRFSIGHELGHFIFHVQCQQPDPRQLTLFDIASQHESTFFRCTNEDLNRREAGLPYLEQQASTSAYIRRMRASELHYRQEIEANQFSAELLMPRNRVRDCFIENPDIDGLASIFGVSKSAMMIRLQSLHLVANQGVNQATLMI